MGKPQTNKRGVKPRLFFCAVETLRAGKYNLCGEEKSVWAYQPLVFPLSICYNALR